MAIIIGAATQVAGDFQGAVSAQWGVQPQINRLWQLGSWDPYRTQVTTTNNVSVTVYAGGGPTINLAPATSCSDSNARFNITISPGTCGGKGANLGISGRFYLMSYSYSKGDAIGLGQQSYSGNLWPGGTGGAPSGANVEYTDAPTLVLQGRTEGNITADSGLNTGMSLSTGLVYGTQGSVSAGFPGLGSATTVTHGFINSVSNGDLRNDGKTGQSQANVPHQPLYF